MVFTPLIIGVRIIRRDKKKMLRLHLRAKVAIKKKAANLTNNFLKYWVPLYVYAGVIFYLSSISKPLPEVSIPFIDKVLHICEYGVFGFLASRAFKNSPRKAFFENFKLLAILVSIIYGISDEFHQGFVSNRQFSVFDMLADGVGGILGTFIYGRYYPI